MSGGVLWPQPPRQQSPRPNPPQGAALGSRAAEEHRPTNSTVFYAAVQAQQFPANPAAMPEADSGAFDTPLPFIDESPSFSGSIFDQVLAPSSTLPVPMSLGPEQSLTGYDFGCRDEQHISQPACCILQPQQSASSSNRQAIQPPEHISVGFVQGPLPEGMCPCSKSGSAVPRGCPTPPGVTGKRLLQSPVERVRLRELAPTNSFTKRGTQQAYAHILASLLRCTQLCNINHCAQQVAQ